MYDKRGKNYCVDTYWGNFQLGKYSRQIVWVKLNTHVNIYFVPRYHSEEVSFPPPLDWFRTHKRLPRNTIEARLNSFVFADLVFYENDETSEKPFNVQSGYYDLKDEFIVQDVTTYCLETDVFWDLTKKLRDSEKEILRRRAEKGTGSPYFPRYEDVMDLEVYRFIHEKLSEWKPFLSKKVVDRLEL